MFIPYKALWRWDVSCSGVEYRLVTVIGPPVFGHVKCIGTPMSRVTPWALPVDEIVGLEDDGYAVVVRR